LQNLEGLGDIQGSNWLKNEKVGCLICFGDL